MAAYKVLGYPHLSMALDLGAVYSKAELESRCSGTPQRKAQLEAKLKDRTLFSPVPLEKAFNRKRKAETQRKPQWVRSPALSQAKKVDDFTGPRRRIAEKMAGDILEAGKIKEKDLLNVLKAWGSYDNKRRKNVRRRDDKPVFSDTFGLAGSRGSPKPVMTSMSKKYPNVTELMNRWFLSSVGRKSFFWTSISLNIDYQAARHRDRNNLGPSAIRGLGKYSGGHLRYWKRDPLTCKVEHLKKKDSILLDIKRKIHYFDGGKAHEVTHKSGQRISLVFFCVQRSEKMSAALRRRATEMGFSLPTSAWIEQAT